MALSPEIIDHYQQNIHLVVKSKFGKHNVGDVVTEPDEILTILTGPNEGSVIKVTKEAEPPVE